MTRLPAPLRPVFPLAKRMVVATTELVGPLSRRLPTVAGRSGPPRSMAASTWDYVNSHPAAGLDLDLVFSPVELTWPIPEGEPARHPVFTEHRRAELESTFVATIPRGRVVGPYGAVITDDDTLLFDLSPYYGAFRPAQHPIFLRMRLPPLTDAVGSVAVLTTRGVDNYYHFLIDVLPRLELLRRTGVTVDRFLVNRSLPFQSQLLDRLGIGEELTIESRAEPHVRAERLLVPTLPDNHLRTPPWVTSWLRTQLSPPTGRVRRRLYVTRGQRRNTRRVDNEAEVIRSLAAFGFEAMDPGEYSVEEQIAAFAEAQVVVGPHGAGLTNLVFCQPGATVIEIFAPDYVNVCYWNLASTIEGLRYRYLVCGDASLRARWQTGVDSDITVDVPELLRLVRSALSE